MSFRLCLVAVKRFPENTYFPEMLISGKGKCFHGVWLHFKKFFGKYFLAFGKEGKHKSENADQKTQATNPGTTNDDRADERCASDEHARTTSTDERCVLTIAPRRRAARSTRSRRSIDDRDRAVRSRRLRRSLLSLSLSL